MKTSETVIGLNLALNRISTVSSSTLKEIESIVPEYTKRPLAKQFKYKESKGYNILIFDTETTTTGKSAEPCYSLLKINLACINSQLMSRPTKTSINSLLE